MKVIAVASQKGGTGKTTLCGHLAVQAGRMGAGPVALIDTDPQGSLSDWWNARRARSPAFVQTTLATLTGDLALLREAGVALVFIDTPPITTAAIVEVIAHADLVLIPVRPSPHDLAAAGTTVEVVERLGKALAFVVNGAPRARIANEAALALSEHGIVATGFIHHRTEFASSMIDGRTVMELPDAPRSHAEITALWYYVADRLERVEHAAAGRNGVAHSNGAISAEWYL